MHRAWHRVASSARGIGAAAAGAAGGSALLCVGGTFACDGEGARPKGWRPPAHWAMELVHNGAAPLDLFDPGHGRLPKDAPHVGDAAASEGIARRAVESWPNLAPGAQALLAEWCGCSDEPEQRPTVQDLSELKLEWFSGKMRGDLQQLPSWETLFRQAQSGELDDWATSAEPLERLSLVLLLDQFPRSLYRGTPKAYSTDSKARRVARKALEDGQVELLPPALGMFFYFPFLHSERLSDQKLALAGLTKISRETPGFSALEDTAQAHHEAVARFGRLPERNKLLGRASTLEELVFLKLKPTC